MTALLAIMLATTAPQYHYEILIGHPLKTPAQRLDAVCKLSGSLVGHLRAPRYPDAFAVVSAVTVQDIACHTEPASHPRPSNEGNYP